MVGVGCVAKDDGLVGLGKDDDSRLLLAIVGGSQEGLSEGGGLVGLVVEDGARLLHGLSENDNESL